MGFVLVDPPSRNPKSSKPKKVVKKASNTKLVFTHLTKEQVEANRSASYEYVL